MESVTDASFKLAFLASDVLEADKERLDKVLNSFLHSTNSSDIEPSRSKCSKWIKNGRVSVNGEIQSKNSYLLSSTDRVELSVPVAKKLELKPNSSIPLDVIHEDESLLVLNKQAGLVVHPGAGAEEETLVHALLHHLGENISRVGDYLRPGIIHRLDKDTTGLMVVAKTDKALQHLRKQFEPPRTIHRTYLAITSFAPERGESSGQISLPLGRSLRDRKKIAHVRDGKEAVTNWRVERQLVNGLLVSVELETGRTHQIRAHFHETNASIVGDPSYGQAATAFPAKLRTSITKLGRQALHASELSFIHPETSKQVSFKAELPEDMKEILRALNGGI